LPEYDQPPIPAEGDMWTPGYWSWNGYEYFWVPGTWVEPPQPGFLWTPGYWAFVGGVYAFHRGYWGEHVGFYGGVNYGFGYGGAGYEGGHWDNGRFFYNRSVTNIGRVNITNVYNQPVTIVDERNRASFNGGPNGVTSNRPPPNSKRRRRSTSRRLPTSSTTRASPAGPNRRSSPPTRASRTSRRRRSPASSRAPRSFHAKAAGGPLQPVGATPGAPGRGGAARYFVASRRATAISGAPCSSRKRRTR
jgi:hypothetical protein